MMIEHVLLALVVASAITIGLLVARLLVMADVAINLRREIQALKATAGNPSVELTEFLKDQSKFGYSFVRVDPAAVSITIPRG